MCKELSQKWKFHFAFQPWPLNNKKMTIYDDDASGGGGDKTRWSGNRRVQQRVSHLLARSQKLKEHAEDDASATHLLYQQDEPGFLEPEQPGEHTTFVRQDRLRSAVSVQSQNKMFTLQLNQGPYVLDYTRNGRFLVLGGAGGTISSMDWQAGRLGCEVDLCGTGEQETVRDVCFLQNETMMAVAQSNYVYIYDGRGIELHRLKKHSRVQFIDFLPFHFLLGSVSEDAFIRWQDITQGTLAAEWRFDPGLGQCRALAQNPTNAILHLAHANGIVSFWSPGLNKSLVRMNCHRGPVRAVAINTTGNAMATAGLDGIIRIWDLRHDYRSLVDIRNIRPTQSMAFSQRNLLAAAFGAHVVVWKDMLGSSSPSQQYPYLRHVVEGHSVHQVTFCPYEDILGVGHSGGFSSLLIPGSGEPNYDIFEANPFAGRRQRQEREVHALLDKLPLETITLDGGQFIGRVARSTLMKTIGEDGGIENRGNDRKKELDEPKEKKKARGRSTALRRYLKKRANIIDKYKAEDAERARTEIIHRKLGLPGESHGDGDGDGGEGMMTSRGVTALNRFVSKAI